MPRRWSYALLHRYGVLVTERRWVIARSVLERVLEGGDPTTQPESNTAAPGVEAAAL